MKNQIDIALNVATVAILMVFIQGIAYGGVVQQLPEKDVDAIKTFFNDFKEAFNTKDIERIKQMSGDTWNRWAKAINEGRLESVDIQDIAVGKQTNVTTKCIVVDVKNRPYPAEVVFTLKQDGAVYSMEKMCFPESEKRHEEFDNARKKVGQLIAAINASDLSSVKELVTFGAATDFEGECSLRGLSWIKDAIYSGAKIASVGSGVSRDGKNVLVGRIYVPCELGGTNVLRKVVFKGGKIDRAAPREETKDELERRIKAEFEERSRALLRHDVSR